MLKDKLEKCFSWDQSSLTLTEYKDIIQIPDPAHARPMKSDSMGWIPGNEV